MPFYFTSIYEITLWHKAEIIIQESIFAISLYDNLWGVLITPKAESAAEHVKTPPAWTSDATLMIQ